MDAETINLCRCCGLWSECEHGFKRWLDQKDCRFAVKSDYRDQCMFTGEIGNCSNHEANAHAKENGLKKEI